MTILGILNEQENEINAKCFIFVCNGANFIQDTDMTRLQKKFLQLMSELDQ